MSVLIENDGSNVGLEDSRTSCQQQEANDEWGSRVSSSSCQHGGQSAEYLNEMSHTADQHADADCVVSTDVNISPPDLD